MVRRPPRSTLFPTRRSSDLNPMNALRVNSYTERWAALGNALPNPKAILSVSDRKSTRLNSSHTVISYAVFCLKKKKHMTIEPERHRGHPGHRSAGGAACSDE